MEYLSRWPAFSTPTRTLNWMTCSSFHSPKSELHLSKKHKLKPGHSEPQTFKCHKHCIVTIKNKDVMCCGRAIVTVKAKVDNHPKWNSFKNGCKIQKEHAICLYYEAGVDITKPCGYPELKIFPQAPSLQDYQLLVIDETRSYHVDAFGPPKDK